ncbi:intermembrane phospholipid transport protein YdbH family protein, partial [Phenylobacterium sp.]|uniref:intermembrane phospholipid transport protein YdbH family protein n=1 Tax=Phenylobacterium sp. TaxID=1871053 RepID=UPI002E349479
SFQLDTGRLVFSPEGLQPAQLSPAAVLIASPAEGEARFVGGFTWSPGREGSGGVLTVPRLDFRGPVGMVRGLSTEVQVTSLAPLVTAPDQVARAERIEAFAPLTDVVATGRVEGEALHLASASATAGRGKVDVEPMTIPFAPGGSWSGAMRLDDVHLGDLIEASPLAEQMDLQAKVDGRVPFQVGPQGVRVSGGEIHAVEPGRLSIKREALTSVAAEGGAPEAEPNLTVDFAYQAMENLAFSRLAAEIDSRPEGRLGVMFYITGEHDPPKRQELRLSWWDLIGQRFLNRTLPLPSGVKVDLALDMSLNLDQLLADWGEYQRLTGGHGGGSATVQPDSLTTGSDSSPGGPP